MFDFLHKDDSVRTATKPSVAEYTDAAKDAFAGAYTRLESLVQLQQYSRQMNLLSAPRRAAQLSGNWQTRIRGRGMDFAEVREYQPGDDIRSMDWRVTARTGSPHSRVFTEERERPVILAADLRSSMFFGSTLGFKSVTAAASLALIGWAAQNSRDRVGGLVMGDNAHRESRPKNGKKGVLGVLHNLDDFSRLLTNPLHTAEQSMLDLLLKLQRVTRPGSSVYLASDFHDFNDDCVPHLQRLARHAQLTLLCISDPLEWKLPEGNSLWVTDGQQRQLLSQQDQLNELLPQRIERLRACTGDGIELLDIRGDGQVLDLLQRRYGQSRASSGKIASGKSASQRDRSRRTSSGGQP
ncbi:DUF58 domain-containing protein [Aliamphritea ceti]|uniref:DUF58 domain-containing protein n=1 Tax=Aliamphritea ceti TaxID=1524258 RepID=UPI0021C3205E|nr:DUF58 domain-containing protein [Aliamphritea ceti]